MACDNRLCAIISTSLHQFEKRDWLQTATILSLALSVAFYWYLTSLLLSHAYHIFLTDIQWMVMLCTKSSTTDSHHTSMFPYWFALWTPVYISVGLCLEEEITVTLPHWRSPWKHQLLCCFKYPKITELVLCDDWFHSISSSIFDHTDRVRSRKMIFS